MDFSALAAAEHLAVVSDFDGTLAGFAEDIYAVQARPDSLEALERLAALPATTAAVLSGRHLAGLRRVCPLRPPVLLAGSHGAECDWPAPAVGAGADNAASAGPSARAEAFLRRKEAEIRDIMRRFPGADIEVKPFQRVLHLRGLEAESPARAAAARAAGLELDTEGFPRTVGKSVIEFSGSRETKGTWIQQLRRHLLPARATVVFLGDDTTDEEGFRALSQPPDLGVKVGPGPSAAAHRVAGVAQVAEFLTELANARERRA